MTERMKELGLTPELLKKWQQEEDEIPEPSWYATPRDRQLLEAHKAEAESTPRNGHTNGADPAQKSKTRRREALAK